jgi:hypothetical protein
MALPGVTEEPHHDHGSFRVGGKIFVTVPPGDEFIHLFLPEEEREQALAMYPAFVHKLLWGGKVRGVKVHLANAERPVVERLVRLAWEHKAPHRLDPGVRRQDGEA